jgi:molybdopterin synthase sulfur carrier subunit
MVEILFFASFREEFGNDKVSIDIADLKSIYDVKQFLIHNHFCSFLLTDNIMTAVNQKMTDDNYQVQNGDIIAFFPTVTGG